MASVGIDPGRNGGIAFISGELLEVKPLPYKHDRLDVKAFRAILAAYRYEHIVLEHVSTHFAASRSASFSFGESFGEVYAMVRLEQAPILLVRPKIWQACLLGKKNPHKIPPKERALKFALNTWPKETWGIGVRGRTNYHDGMIDAACLAFWGEVKRLNTVLRDNSSPTNRYID